MSKNTVKSSKAQASQSIVASGLSQAAQNILVKNLSAKNVAGAAGPDVNDLNVADEVTLALVILDESGSMDDDQAQVVREYDDNIDAIRGSKQADQILLTLWAFNTRSRLIHSYLTMDLVEKLTDYHPDGGTALYDAILDGLTGLVDYENTLKQQGMRVKLNVAVLTDGDDNSSHASAQDVKTVVEEIRRKRENATFTLIALGNDVDETVLANSMGFPDPKQFDKTPAGRRRAFGTWSSSVIKTSQTKIAGGSQSSFFTP
ncbi:MAG: hypothetical protein UU16_C0015G0007 [Candidatus Woesebacteria bacterium GW2011_GWA2_40_7]|nr:MAG: hypothetical protein UT17_C0004G0259 [Candidatus Woesebacteria bacterium GW2011_GWB1_39_10]KKR73711.1 MAG: hypothetical protein UU16_C0015G0007 [Candidatus Woesebacteria bacterium GW2011_GWA2_40_7]